MIDVGNPVVMHWKWLNASDEAHAKYADDPVELPEIAPEDVVALATQLARGAEHDDRTETDGLATYLLEVAEGLQLPELILKYCAWCIIVMSAKATKATLFVRDAAAYALSLFEPAELGAVGYLACMNVAAACTGDLVREEAVKHYLRAAEMIEDADGVDERQQALLSAYALDAAARALVDSEPEEGKSVVRRALRMLHVAALEAEAKGAVESDAEAEPEAEAEAKDDAVTEVLRSSLLVTNARAFLALGETDLAVKAARRAADALDAIADHDDLGPALLRVGGVLREMGHEHEEEGLRTLRRAERFYAGRLQSSDKHANLGLSVTLTALKDALEAAGKRDDLRRLQKTYLTREALHAPGDLGAPEAASVSKIDSPFGLSPIADADLGGVSAPKSLTESQRRLLVILNANRAEISRRRSTTNPSTRRFWRPLMAL